MVSPISPLNIGQSPSIGDMFQHTEAMQGGIQAQNLKNQSTEQDMHVRNLQILNALGGKLLQSPQEQRSGILNSYSGVLNSIGVTPEEISQAPLDDAGLKSFVDNTSAILQQLQQPQNKGYQFDKQIVLKDSKGNLFYATQVGEAGSGNVSSKVVSVNGDPNLKPEGKLEIVGTQGYTPTEGVGIAGQKAIAETTGKQQVLAQTQPDIAKNVKLAEQQAIVQTQPTIESETTKAKTQSEIEAKKQAETKANLPALEDTTTNLIRYVDELQNHPARAHSTGLWSAVPAIPGTDRADFKNRLDQIAGGTFLQQYASLKGGGAITDVEGKKAESAANRISAATSDKEFDAAVKDFKAILNQTLERARKQSGESSAPKKLVYDPSTGTFK